MGHRLLRQLTSVLSISHRITGVLLGVVAIGIVVWLVALASGPETFARVAGVTGSLPGMVILFAFTLAFNFHLCNGIRHLVWDTGAGLEIDQVYASGWTVVVASIVLSVLVWALALFTGGAA